MFQSATSLINYRVRALNDTIGSVSGFLFDDTSWVIRYVIVDIPLNENGGVRNALIAPFSFGILNPQTRELPLIEEKQKVENSPFIDLKMPFSRKLQIELYKYYKWPPFDLDDVFHDMQSSVTTKYLNWEESIARSHLINTGETIGYYIEAADGEIGQVHDFIIDEECWIIRYISVNIGKNIPEKKVLIFPRDIKAVNLVEAKVYINIVQDTVMNSPEYITLLPIDRGYESRIHKYYGYPRYWD